MEYRNHYDIIVVGGGFAGCGAAIAAAEQVKVYGRDNDLLQRIAEDPAFGLTAEELEALADPSAFTGMAGSQCARYLHDVIKPILEQNRADMQSADEINV